MTETAISKEKELFDRAFELAYFIHANKEIAFFIAEDALEGLSSLLGYQKKNRPPSERLRGFWKWGERSRPVRKTLLLNEYQMLQWLVFKKSEHWELQTERSRTFYTPSEDDLIVRYIEHLVYLTTRRGSFYVALAICSLLHPFHRRETRLIYDVLTQSDSARMKDTNYIGKQRLELLNKIYRRFESMLATSDKSGVERPVQFNDASQVSTTLVRESLRRFVPWKTQCAIEPNFDVTDIPALYFSPAASGEESENDIELNRIHTLVHPECFEMFSHGIDQYVRSLPDTDLDASCEFDSATDRLLLPEFTNLKPGPPRRDRFDTPKLRAEDYVRVRRMIEARGNRKKTFAPQTLSVYADDDLLFSFAPEQRAGKCLIQRETGVIEVRGEDAAGEVVLAMLVRTEREAFEDFEDSITHPGGQRILLRLKPFALSQDGDSSVQLEIQYTQNLFSIGSTMQRTRAQFKTLGQKASGFVRSLAQVRLIPVGATLVFVVLTCFVIWQVHLRTRIEREGNNHIGSESTASKIISQPSPVSSPTEESHEPKAVGTEIDQAIVENIPVARASWSKNPEKALQALALERTRTDTAVVNLSHDQEVITISLPAYDSSGKEYSRFRVTLSSNRKKLWHQVLKTPSQPVTGYTHLLDLLLFRSQFRKGSVSDLEIEGLIGSNWNRVGEMRFMRR